MLVKFGENDVKTVEDLAGCATDDLIGWTERKDGETVKHAGYLDGFELTREEAETMIMTARVHAGWIDAIPQPALEEALEARPKIRDCANQAPARGSRSGRVGRWRRSIQTTPRRDRSGLASSCGPRARRRT